jgi:hypothetical protein
MLPEKNSYVHVYLFELQSHEVSGGSIHEIGGVFWAQCHGLGVGRDRSCIVLAPVKVIALLLTNKHIAAE